MPADAAGYDDADEHKREIWRGFASGYKTMDHETTGPESWELISALKQSYQVQERKLESNPGNRHYQTLRETMVSTTDPESRI